MSKAARNEQILTRIQNATGLSNGGRNALQQLVNPFPDLPHPGSCYPSVDQAPSVIQVIKKSVNITAPAGLAAGTTWDCNIYTLPIHGSTDISRAALRTGSNTIVSPSTNLAAPANFLSTKTPVGSINILTAPSSGYGTISGVGLNSLGAVSRAATSLMTISALSADAAQVSGISTVIGIGFEVHNTTAEINKQGSVVVYQFPQSNSVDRTSVNLYDTTNLQSFSAPIWRGQVPVHPITDAPANRAEALLYHGSAEWKAADGVYCVPKLIDGDIQVSRNSRTRPMIVSTYSSGGIDTDGTAFLAALDAYVPVTPTAATVPIGCTWADFGESVKITDFNSVGSFFTGLSDSTTLTLNYIIYVQRRPVVDDSNLTTLAAPPPMYDPLLKAVYTACMHSMPPGTMVKNNASGDWFWNAVSSVTDFLTPALTAVKTPMGMIGFGAATLVGNYAKKKLAEGAAADALAAAKKNTIKMPDPGKPNAPTVSPTWVGNKSIKVPPPPPISRYRAPTPAKVIPRSNRQRAMEANYSFTRKTPSRTRKNYGLQVSRRQAKRDQRETRLRNVSKVERSRPLVITKSQRNAMARRMWGGNITYDELSPAEKKQVIGNIQDMMINRR